MLREPKAVFVTGCSSGIGYSLVKQLCDGGYRVAATCRRPNLNRLRSSFEGREQVAVIELDVTDDAQRKAAVASAYERFGVIDVLVNNAGVSYRAAIEDMTVRDDQCQFATNFLGPLELMKLVIPGMRSRGSGRIVNVSSVGGMMAMPTMGSYSASKFALEGASEALWYELKPFGVTISLVEPGFINSDSFQHVMYSEKVLADGIEATAYARVYEDMSRFVEKNMRRARATPESVAAKIIRVIGAANPPLRVPVTFDAHVFALLRRVVPRRMYHELLYRMLPNISRWRS